MNSEVHTQRVQRCWYLSMALLLSLIVLYAVKTLLLWPQPLEMRFTLWGCQVVPLLILLPGMVKRRWQSFAWLCFLIQFYFMTAVLAVFKKPPANIDFVVLLNVVLIFLAAMFFIRWRRSEVESSEVESSEVESSEVETSEADSSAQ